MEQEIINIKSDIEKTSQRIKEFLWKEWYFSKNKKFYQTNRKTWFLAEQKICWKNS